MKKIDLKSMIIGFLGCIIFLMLTGQTFTIGTVEEVPKSFDISAGNYEIECWPGAVKTHARCVVFDTCLLYTSPSPRDLSTSRMPSSA